MLGCEKGNYQTVIKIYTRDTKLEIYTHLVLHLVFLYSYSIYNLKKYFVGSPSVSPSLS